MKSTADLSGERSMQPFQMLLRVRRRRSRKGISEKATEDDGDMPPRVRVRWDDNSGHVPLISACDHYTNSLELSSSTETAVFQRLQKNVTISRGQGHMERALTSSLISDSKANEVGGTTLCVNAVKRAHQYILIDCVAGDIETPLGTGEEMKEDLYVMLTDSSKLQKDTPSPTCSDHSDEFDFDKLTISERPLPAIHPIRQIGKRPRDASGSVHTFFLVPSRRARPDGGGVDAEAPSSSWPPICEDHDNTLLDCIHGYGDFAPFVLESSGAAQEDLYCCADHRKDDEYDSNAEDFSANDYPETEQLDNSMPDIDDDCTAHEDNAFSEICRASRRCTDYGVFCEPDYLETSLGEGWESD
ncbi:unnamed protein product [Phytomonas sp. EM1]|nr:unnamed protein product [Phytomonas sp. EM1]|eukprot:CCW63039.1 unnamed protein product [Phytomonas sp. isolate EM1]